MAEDESRIDRRGFLKTVGGAVGAIALSQVFVTSGFSLLRPYRASGANGSLGLAKYVDPLSVPGVMQPVRRMAGGKYYVVSMSQFTQKLHRDLPPTPVWGYNGTYPGATFEVTKNERIAVLWKNELPDEHLLPVDTAVPGAEYPENPLVRTVVHLHGGHVEPASDGYPEAWFTRGFEVKGPHFQKEIYEYTNSQNPATLWYHDHALGITRLNVYTGLAGFYLLRDRWELGLNLPSGPYEIPILIQDRSFNEDGSLFYPEDFMPEFFGNTAVVNGKVWPYLKVEPRKYRFRLLNGSTGRFYNLTIMGGPPFYQIGTDGGLLRAPVRIENRLLLGPAERADVVVDFSGFEGQSLLLHNDAKTPFESLDQTTDEVPLPEIMRFDVLEDVSAEDRSSLPMKLAAIPKLQEQSAVTTRDLTLQMKMAMKPSGGMWMVHFLNGSAFHDPVTEKPQLGTTEIWRLLNLIDDAHPIHLHLVMFQVLDRRPFDVEHFKQTGELSFTGDPVPPAANEAGWKDTVRTDPGTVTRIIAHFGDYAGRYVWHCHILEHEDLEMMRPYEVVVGRRGGRRR